MKTPFLALTLLFSAALLHAGSACVSSIEICFTADGASLHATAKSKSEKSGKPSAPQPPPPSAPEPRREPPPARPAHLFM